MNSPDANLAGGAGPEKRESKAAPIPNYRALDVATRAMRTARRILLVDDDPGVREMLGRVLELERYEVIHASTGNEAARRFVSENPDLVLLDLNMPERDGWSAFRFMNAAHPRLPVIIITARSNQYQQAGELGVDALMEKPLDLPVLLGAIADLLNETATERTQRLTRPGFKTALLTRQTAPPLNRANP